MTALRPTGTFVSELLSRKCGPATNMFVIVSGRCRIEESEIELGPGNVVGELSLLAPKHRHTRTLKCVKSGKVFRMNIGQVEKLFFQNPKFGFNFLKLIVSRMLENRERLERTLAVRDREISDLRKEITRVSGAEQMTEAS